VGTLGSKFHNERERRGLTLDDVSNVTKISSRMLKAIEEEHFDQLPGGVFNKGFIRAYARHLGLDGEEAVNEYLAWLRQAQVDAYTFPAAARGQETRAVLAPAPRAPSVAAEAAIAPKAEIKGPAAEPEIHHPATAPESQPAAPVVPPAARDEVDLPGLQLPRIEHVRPRILPAGGTPNAIPWALPAAAAAIIFLVFILWNWHSHSARAGASIPAPAAPTAAKSAPAAPAFSNPSSSSPAAAPPIVASTHPSHSSSPATPASTPPPSQFHSPLAQPEQPQVASQLTPSGAPNQPVKPSAPFSANAATPLVVEKGDVTMRTLSPPTHAAPVVAALPRFTLVIRALENSRISVTADGQVVSQETLIAPAYTSVRATREIVVQAENAAAVSFLLNGKDIPSQGVEGSPQTFVFDNNGLRSSPAN
jgi:cytoskeletal protein RodZ